VVDLVGNAETYNGTSWSAPTKIADRLNAVSCPTSSFCVAVDSSGDALTYNGTSWSAPTKIDGNNVLRSVSCPTSTFCVAVDQNGNALTYAPPTTPTITAFKLTHTRFTVGLKPTATNAKAKAKIPRGSAFLYTLSQASTATIVIDRQKPGRLVGKKCVAQTKTNANKKRCTITVRAGTLTRNSKAGSNTISFSGRLGRTALRAATYQATITARVGNGPTSKPRSATFTIIRG
jgi:hypothetical protein